MIGNLICLEGGSGTLTRTRRQITGHTDTNTITVDASVATGTGITGKVGGALASLGEWARTMVAGNEVHCKGSESVLTNTQNIATGKVSMVAGTATNFSRIIGYTTTRGDGGQYTFANAVAGTNDMIVQANRCSVHNVIVTCNSVASVDGINATVNVALDVLCENCKVSGVGTSAYGFNYSNTGGRWQLRKCEATGVGGTAAFGLSQAGLAVGCVAHDNTCDGFVCSVSVTLDHCISESNSGATSDGFVLANGCTALFCTAYNNGLHGFVGAAATMENVSSCVSYGNAGWGFHLGSAGETSSLVNCSGGDNDLGNYDTTLWATWQVLSFVALTADPFTDAAGAVFDPNDVTPGGKDLQSSGAPQTYPGNSTRGRPTIGTSPKGGGGLGPGQPVGGGGGHVIGS